MVRALAALAGVCLAVAGCGGSSAPSFRHTTSSTQSSTSQAAATPAAPAPAPPAYPIMARAARAQGLLGWTPVVSVHGQTAVWLSRVAGEGEPITMLRFDQSLLQLALHAGWVDPGGSGWPYGSSISPLERLKVVAGFEGGFMLTDNVGGFVCGGRVGRPLSDGLASIVTYAAGQTDIGAWRREVPASGKPILSVRQNLSPLIDNGQVASNVTSCVRCWGPTLGGGLASARGGLGIDASGALIYAGGERLTVSALARALAGVGVQRAAELDINPEWVNLYLYAHHDASPAVTVMPTIPGQPGIPGQLLTPYGRDFFTVVVR